MIASARRSALLALSFGVVASISVVTLYSCVQRDLIGAGGTGSAAPVEIPPAFSLAGSLVGPLVPGMSAAVDVTVTNRREHPITVRDLTVSIDSVTAPLGTDDLSCSLRDFSVAQTDVEVTVPAERTASLSELGWNEQHWPRISMRDTDYNQNGCVEATLSLGLTGLWAVSG